MEQFDSEARNSAREALAQYIQRNKIGVPTLAKQIEASHPDQPNIPVKILQRFLDGKLQIVDTYARYFIEFAEKNAHPSNPG